MELERSLIVYISDSGNLNLSFAYVEGGSLLMGLK